jgi:glycosyltransferase involved in cell wall biosynthesis
MAARNMPTDSPLITVVMPTLNAAEHFDRSLGSLAEQTFKDFELIIVDGGSQDGGIEQAKQFLSGAMIRFQIVLAPGTGIYEAMNLGVQMAEGEWLYVMGSDDMLLSADVFTNISASLKHCDDHTAVIHGDVWIEEPGYLYGGPWDLRRLVERNLSHQSAFYRSDAVRSLALVYDIKYPIYADWDYNLKLLAWGCFQYVPVSIASYGCTGTSSLRRDERFLADKEANAIRYFGLRACWLLPPDRFALGWRRQPTAINGLRFFFNRLYWGLRRILRQPE